MTKERGHSRKESQTLVKIAATYTDFSDLYGSWISFERKFYSVSKDMGCSEVRRET